MIEIKNCFTGNVLRVVDANTLEKVNLMRAYLVGANLRGADLTKANLRGADLTRADLRGADLTGADLRGANLPEAILAEADLRGADLTDAVLEDCTGNMREICSMQCDVWPVTWLSDLSAVQIGCERHSWEAWLMFDDTRIAAMDPFALGWWRKWRPILDQVINATQGAYAAHDLKKGE